MKPIALYLLVVAAAVLPISDNAFAKCASGVWKLERGTARDTRTGLTWQRCGLGTHWRDGGCRGELSAVDLADAQAAAPNGWRLPTIEELATLVDEACDGLAIDRRAFPDLAADSGETPFWSSSFTGMAELYYYVDFGLRMIDAHSAGFALSARYVRDDGAKDGANRTPVRSSPGRAE